MSQCSPVWKTGTIACTVGVHHAAEASQCSPVWKTGTMSLERFPAISAIAMSQCSPVWKTGTICAPENSGRASEFVSM